MRANALLHATHILRTMPTDAPDTDAFDDDATRVVRRHRGHARQRHAAGGPGRGRTGADGGGPLPHHQRIGRGGMASVYRAHDPSIDRALAIKFLHTAYCEDEEYRGRFLREARAAGNLSHPNIVTVHDVGEIDHRPYMAMELIDGEPLNELMSRVGPMPIARRDRRSASSSARRSTTRTARASCTATSSRRTSCCWPTRSTSR